MLGAAGPSDRKEGRDDRLLDAPTRFGLVTRTLVVPGSGAYSRDVLAERGGARCRAPTSKGQLEKSTPQDRGAAAPTRDGTSEPTDHSERRPRRRRRRSPDRGHDPRRRAALRRGARRRSRRGGSRRRPARLPSHRLRPVALRGGAPPARRPAQSHPDRAQGGAPAALDLDRTTTPGSATRRSSCCADVDA